VSTAGDYRAVIVNADDFGLSAGVNQGITTAFERGILTSASLMVRADAAAEAAAYARLHSMLGVGLHVDLGEWRHVGGYDWRAVYEVVRLDDEEAVAREVDRQLDRFRELLGREPTHLDSHQHVHLKEPVRSVLRRLAVRLGVPLRHFSGVVRYCGEFYGQWNDGRQYLEAISADGLIRTILGLSPGITELACHPGDDPGLDSDYREERSLELAALCDPRVREALVGARIELRTFEGVAAG
jgi:predicted glycoside hydrolase/deacetylase ChbG (UPF0249 family)